MDINFNQSLGKICKFCLQIHRILWVGSDPEGLSNPTLKWRVHPRIPPTTLVFVSAGSNQLLSGRECLNVTLK